MVSYRRIGEMRVHRYENLESKVRIVSTLTSLGTLDDTFLQNNVNITLVPKM